MGSCIMDRTRTSLVITDAMTLRMVAVISFSSEPDSVPLLDDKVVGGEGDHMVSCEWLG